MSGDILKRILKTSQNLATPSFRMPLTNAANSIFSLKSSSINNILRVVTSCKKLSHSNSVSCEVPGAQKDPIRIATPRRGSFSPALSCSKEIIGYYKSTLSMKKARINCPKNPIIMRRAESTRESLRLLHMATMQRNLALSEFDQNSFSPIFDIPTISPAYSPNY